MTEQVPDTISFEVSLQRTRAGGTWLYQAMVMRDGNACEGRNPVEIMEEFLNGVKTGGYCHVFDLRRASSNGEVKAREASFDAPPRPDHWSPETVAAAQKPSPIVRVNAEHPVFTTPDAEGAPKPAISDIPEEGIILKNDPLPEREPSKLRRG